MMRRPVNGRYFEMFQNSPAVAKSGLLENGGLLLLSPVSCNEKEQCSSDEKSWNETRRSVVRENCTGKHKSMQGVP
jgi:hypothetical protein